MFDRFLSWFGLARKRDLARVEKELERVIELSDSRLESWQKTRDKVHELYSRLAESIGGRDYTAVYNSKLNALRARVDAVLERSMK